MTALAVDLFICFAKIQSRGGSDDSKSNSNIVNNKQQHLRVCIK